MRTLMLALFLTACGGGAPAAKPDEAKKPDAAKTEPAKAEPAKAEPAKPAGDHGAHGAPAGEVGAFVPLDGNGRRIFFADLKDGAKVKSPFKVKFGAEGVEVKPAGDLTPNSGHHHIVVDGKPILAGQAVPKDEKNIHYGKGETEAELTLPPGPHTLTLQLADFAHRSYGPVLSATVSITVEP